MTVGLAIGAALTLLAAFEWPGCWPVIVAAPLLLGWLALGARTARRAVLVVYLIQIPLWLWMCRWIVPITAAGMPLLAIYLALYPALFVAIIRRLGRVPPTSSVPMTVQLPVAWVGLELLRGAIVMNGYPWYLLGHPLVELPVLVQSADLIGAYGVSFIAAMPAGAVLDLMRSRHATRAERRGPIRAAVVALAVIAVSLIYGAWRLSSSPDVPGQRVLVIQTNLPQDNKIGWSAERQQVDVPHFIQLTRDALLAAGEVDLIVWPETMLPGIGLEPATLDFIDQYVNLTHLRQWTDALIALQREIDVPMLVGSLAWVGPQVVTDGNGSFLHRESEFNSAYLVDGPAPFQRYDKVFLTPFGETMPYISSWPWLEEKVLAIGARGMSFSLDRADEPRIITLVADGAPPRNSLATPICFEDTVPRLCRRMSHEGGRKRIGLLINLSNDGWFGTHDAGRRADAQIARFRCIENRVAMIRAVNTGLSVSIDSAGRLQGAIGAGGGGYGTARRDGWMLAEPTIDERRTLYGRIGDAWAWMCLVATALLIIWSMVGRRGSP